MTKDLTTQGYADLYGCTARYVQRMIKEKKKLPHVTKIKRHGKIYLLVVPKQISKRSFKKKAA